MERDRADAHASRCRTRARSSGPRARPLAAMHEAGLRSPRRMPTEGAVPAKLDRIATGGARGFLALLAAASLIGLAWGGRGILGDAFAVLASAPSLLLLP